MENANLESKVQSPQQSEWAVFFKKSMQLGAMLTAASGPCYAAYVMNWPWIEAIMNQMDNKPWEKPSLDPMISIMGAIVFAGPAVWVGKAAYLGAGILYDKCFSEK